jgi:hypothetical protein
MERLYLKKLNDLEVEEEVKISHRFANLENQDDNVDISVA